MKKRHKKNKRIPIYIFVLVLTTILVVFYAAISYEIKYEDNKSYYTGNLYTPNHSANLIDYTDGNQIISPINLNKSLIALYYGSDNNTKKELNTYFKNNEEKSKEQLLEIQKRNTVSSYIENEFTNNYEKLMNEFINNNYNNLTIDILNSMETEEKEKIQLLIKKINLNYERITGQNELTIKYINKYVLSKKEINNNSYNIKDNIDDILNKWESYNIKPTIRFDNRFYYNKDLKINKEYVDKINDLDITLTPTEKNDTNIINMDINSWNRSYKNIEFQKEIELISINIVDYINEWDIPFTKDNIRSSEFTNKGNISAVDMMYGEESTYLENNYAIGFQKDFKNKEYSFIGILPKKEEYIASNLDLNNFINSTKKGPVKIGIPRFEINSSINLIDLLSHEKIQFQKSNLSKMIDTNPKINLYEQKILFQIGDKGTIDTKVSLNNNEPIIQKEYKKEIILNSPFYFLIMNNETKDIIFIGRISELG